MAKMLYKPDVGEEICLRLSEGEPIKNIVARPGIPSYAIVQRWRRESPEFEERYRAARRAGAEWMFDEMVERLERMHYDIEHIDDSRKANATVMAYKIEFDTKRWILGKMNPEEFAQGMETSDGQPMFQVVVQNNPRNGRDLEGEIEDISLPAPADSV